MSRVQSAVGEEAGSGHASLSAREQREGETYIDSFMRETRRDGGTFFFGFAEEEGEFLDCGHGNVSTVIAGQKGLAVVSVAITERDSATWELSIPCPSSLGRIERMPWCCIKRRGLR